MPEFCWISLLAPKDDEVEFKSLRPDPLLLKEVEADRYLIGDWLNSDINNFIILNLVIISNATHSNRLSELG